MDIEKINEMWAQDCVIGDDLFKEGQRIPKLHQKYYDIYFKEGLRLKAEKIRLVDLQKSKTEYFRGQMDPAEVRQRGWPPLGSKVLKEDVPLHVECDTDVISQSLKVGMIDSKVKYLEDILKQVHSRNFIIKSMGDWRRFENGTS